MNKRPKNYMYYNPSKEIVLKYMAKHNISAIAFSRHVLEEMMDMEYGEKKDD